MTKDDARAWFNKWILPAILNREQGDKNINLRIVAWSEYTDALWKDGKITHNQYMDWSLPNSMEMVV